MRRHAPESFNRQYLWSQRSARLAIFFYFHRYFGSLAKARGKFSEVMGVCITFCWKLNGIYKWGLLTGNSTELVIWQFFLTEGLWTDFTAWKWNTCSYVIQQSKAKYCLAWIYCEVLWDSSGFWNCFCKGKWGQAKGNKNQNLLCYRGLHKLSK